MSIFIYTGKRNNIPNLRSTILQTIEINARPFIIESLNEIFQKVELIQPLTKLDLVKIVSQPNSI